MSRRVRRRALLAGLVALAALAAASSYIVGARAQGESNVARAGSQDTSSEQTPVPNNMGWRVGTAWTVRMEHYATYLAEPGWVTADYRLQVVAGDVVSRTFTVSVRFADRIAESGSGQSELVRAVYRVRNGTPVLSSLQLEGRGPVLSADEAGALIGDSFFSMELPSSPFSNGETVRAESPNRGPVEANRVRFGEKEAATFARGVPWWLSYSKGDGLRARLVRFEN